MNKISTPSKKEILNLFNRFSDYLSQILSNLKYKNFLYLSKNIISDRRFIITTIIIFVSIFAHLSTPSFYKDRWVLEKIKIQLEKEFNFEFILPDEVNYSMFPVPSFYLKNIKIKKNKREVGKIDLMKIYLSFSKFFDKEKVNIQDIHISNSKFNILNKDLKNFITFFDKQINNKKLKIKNSKIFLKDNENEVYLILSLNKSTSYFNDENLNNVIDLNGDIFNVPIKAKIQNNYLTKKANLNFDLDKIGKKLNFDIDYLNDINKIILEIFDKSNIYISDIEFNKKNLNFTSRNNKKKYSYEGNVNFNPFFSDIKIDFDNFDLNTLVNPDSVFSQIIDSKIFNNSNLNYKINISSKNIENHRLLKDLIVTIKFNQNNFSLDESKLIFDNNVLIQVKNSDLIFNQNEKVFSGEIDFEIKDSDRLYKFFLSKKEFRKKLNNINLVFNYNFDNHILFIERLSLNNKFNNKLQEVVDNLNKKNFKNFGRIEIKNYFNEIITAL